jgi:hypothetical protein
MTTRYGSILVFFIVLGVGTYWAFSANERTALRTLRDYAEAYEPTPEHGNVVPKLPNLPQEVSEAIQSLHDAQNTTYEQYIYLIVLKLHRYYLEQFHQGYDIRTIHATGGKIVGKIEHPLLREFCHLARIDIQRAEQEDSMLSWIIVDWINIHSYYRHYGPIQHEMVRIENVQKQIERGDFWNTNDSE